MSNFESFKLFFSTEWVLGAGILFLILAPLLKRRSGGRAWAGVVAFVVAAFALLATLATQCENGISLFGGFTTTDPFSQFFKIIILLTVMATIILSNHARDLEQSPKPEYYAFLLTLTLGLTLMTTANHLLMIYLSIEIASIASYILAAYITGDHRSGEAGLKYVLYGGVASAIMIFGMSLLYGITGALQLNEIQTFLMDNSADRLALLASLLMIFAGLGYKMAVAPFHMWAPDVYEGAPLPVTAFLSVASKAAGFAVTLRFLVVGFGTATDDVWARLPEIDWQILVACLSAITMTVGNLLAIQQTNIKRFLAYSSIAHAGYLLMAVAANSKAGVESILFYFIVYFLMNMGAFFVAGQIANQFKTEDMADYKGLVRQSPFGMVLALCMAIFLFSLAGIPPFAGFVGKWYIFKSVIDANLIWLAVIGIINSVISLFFYARLAKFMLVDDKTSNLPVSNTRWSLSSVTIAFAFLSVYFGIWFGPLVKWVQGAAVLLR